MTARTYTKSTLLAGLIVLSIGGILLHTRIHPPQVNHTNLIPAICCILSIIVVPLLFCFRQTISFGYVINGFIVIIGTITMAHYSFVHWPNPATIQAVLLTTTLADILILFGKFFIGKSIFDLETFGYESVKPDRGSTYRYPNMGWWFVHLVAVSVVYYFGIILWR